MLVYYFDVVLKLFSVIIMLTVVTLLHDFLLQQIGECLCDVTVFSKNAPFLPAFLPEPLLATC